MLGQILTHQLLSLSFSLLFVFLYVFIKKYEGWIPRALLWSRVCLHNMAHLAKEATTIKRVPESLLCYFDNVDFGPLQHGLALSVLLDM